MLVAASSSDLSFDRLAPHYTWMENILAGPRLQRARLAFVDALASRKRLLIAGVGHGHFLRACALRFPHLEIVGIDVSAGMLQRAQRHASPDRHKFAQATLPDWTPPVAHFDAIATHFFLDCFPPGELARVVTILASAAQSNAAWLVTDFSIPDHGWRRQRARAIHRAMYAFFRPVTGIRARCVTPPDAHLAAHGFQLAGRRTTNFGLLQSDLWVRDPPTPRENSIQLRMDTNRHE